MFPNLEAEMARLKLTNADCAKVCCLTEKGFSNKRCGRTEFTLPEIKILREKLFPNCSLEYLFSSEAESLNNNNGQE